MSDNNNVITPKPKRQLTKPEFEILKAAAEIAQNSPTEEDRAYMARQLVQATLPHKNPGNVPAWSRTNGNLTLGIQPGVDFKSGKSLGYPYGTIPRLLLFWITTEALANKPRELENPRRLYLGHSLTKFMLEIGMNPDNGTGKRSDARRLRDQMERLFRSRISFEVKTTHSNRRGTGWLDMPVAPHGMLWWDPKEPDQGTLWESWIDLGEDFYKAITAFPVPIDLRALRALKRSPLALDLYAWLALEAFKAHKAGNLRFVAWDLLHEQFGGDYSDMKNFAREARKALRKIQAVYPRLKIDTKRGGITIFPKSLPAITPRVHNPGDAGSYQG
jgi:hypothetical protein